jgi:hypothetical protein
MATTDLKWVFRPDADRPPEERALDGTAVHATHSSAPDGTRDIVLVDGTQLRVTRAELVVE